MVRSSVSLKSKDNTQLYVILGIIAFAIIMGTIIGSGYRNSELFTNNKKLVYLYMENCPYCKNFDNEWSIIVDKVKNNKEYNFTTEKYNLNDNSLGTKYAKDNKIEYAPAIILISSKTVEYNEQTRNADAILKWASKQE